MTPFVVGRDPWNREAMRRDLFTHGLWQFRSGTGNFAWAGIDMALWDVCGRACGEPLWRLLGGLQPHEATYFYYLARGTRDEPSPHQVADGLAAGFEVFYLKVGLDDADDLEMVAAVREALGAGPRLRLDANGTLVDPTGASQPAGDRPSTTSTSSSSPSATIRSASSPSCAAASTMAVCANEGLWSEADAYARIRARQADVYCFSPYWVGSIAGLPPALAGSPITRGSRSASTPTASSGSPRRPATTSC